MKKSKWRKWQIGAVASLGVAFLFREVKGSAEFAQAAAKEGLAQSGSTQAEHNRDPVMDEFRSGNSDNGTNQNGEQRHEPERRTAALPQAAE